MNAKEIFERFRENSLSRTEAGTKFEEFVQTFLLTDPEFSAQLESVWTWKEFPYTQGHDIGIDLVAKTNEDEYWAIQCKFYDESHTIAKADIDTFLAASGQTFLDDAGKQHAFAARYLFSTTDSWSKSAEKEIEGQIIPVQRFGLINFEQSAIDWDSFNFDQIRSLRLKSRKKLREHQLEALNAVTAEFEAADRVRMILACGTGKTFTSLEIARRQTSDNGNVLFLAPSISLVAQSMKEWMIECGCQIYPFVVCSDSTASRDEDFKTCDLIHPATTNTKNLVRQYRAVESKEGMKVFFSCYQSIDVVSEAQKELGITFDLVICDEAHRTTGVKKSDQDGSYFTKVHSDEFIQSRKRLYMTATPRVYTPAAKAKANENQYEISSMDDETIYGREAYRLGFAESIRRGLLCDYKVQIIAVDENVADSKFRELFDMKDLEVKVDDAAKIYGTWMGLSKYSNNPDEYKTDPDSMKRAILYTNTIADSRKVEKLFRHVIELYNEDGDGYADVEIEHVDGKMSASDRSQKLSWLREETDGETCRVLTNARCLSEGIDVPALDGVAFLNPRASIIDIIQAVGRVMRKPASGDKKYGYILLPVVIRASEDPNKVLSQTSYKVVWNVLQALRAHDERLDAEINKIALTGKSTGRAGGGGSIGVDVITGGEGDGVQLAFNLPEIDRIRGLIISKIVATCGDKKYWENWAKDVAEISERHMNRIRNLLAEGDSDVTAAFSDFLESLKSNINATISEDDAVEMLAQHMITEPIFSSLFEGYSFAKSNPVAQEMDKMLDALSDHGLEDERKSLDKFYLNVRERCAGIDTLEGRQKVISDLYGSFFKTAFPKQAESLGIVYSPTPLIDFIISSCNCLLKQEFGKTLGDAGVNILDPFTGTGSFITRLISGGYISKEALPFKWKYGEINANEIVLLAYYIATVNIEETYHSVMGMDHYEPFNGIVLTDTFQMYEDGDVRQNLGIPENSERIADQKKKKITVIMSNCPYSAKQSNANDDNQNIHYLKLEKRIADTYIRDARKGTNKQSLYDSYIKSFRWATDRLGNDSGIIGFVTNGSFIDGIAMDGFRKHLVQDFTDIYVFNLRGNQRTSGELSRKEGGKVFGSGCRAPIAITLLVKNLDKPNSGKVHYYDIGDYLSRQEKLDIITQKENIGNIDWELITPDENNDWINCRNDEFESYIAIGNKKSRESAIFEQRYSRGIATGRDTWVYNFSNDLLCSNVQDTINFFNSEVDRYSKESNEATFHDFVNKDKSRIKWNGSLENKGKRKEKLSFKEECVYTGSYRPFCKEKVYFGSDLNEAPYKMPNIFPDKDSKNLVIELSGLGSTKDFSLLMTDNLADVQRIQNGQCFPLYWYEKNTGQANMFSDEEYIRHDGISDEYLKKCRHIYNDETITKEDIFYYIYGILHSPGYRSKFEADLKKSLPRIPFSKNFWTFSKAGHELADLHLNYETVEPYPLEEIGSGPYTVQKMKYASRDDHSALIYNDFIKLTGIPKEVDEYVVNGRTALGWIIEQYQIKTDKDSGIVNDSNDWCKEVGDDRYIIDLVKRICTVSVETVRIVNLLPPLDVIQKKIKK